jgi:DnaJ-domain-containing protein 1
MQRRMLSLMLEELQGWMNDLVSDMLQPEIIVNFIRSMGFDISRLPGMISQQPGFDPYQVLGLDKSATDEEVKKRYRDLMFKLHPDTAGTPGTGFLFQMVLVAYEMIKSQRGWQ